MISTWKLQRELARLRTQVAAIPALISQPIVQRRYDKRRADIVKIKQGELPCGENVVIYLIFQPNGVSESVLETCRYLNSSGFSPIVISNCELSSEDEFAIATNAHLVVQRPNYGYDFGGYRDGVWLLNARGIAPKALVFLNDSVWFPAIRGVGVLDQMLNHPSPYVGVQSFGDISNTGNGLGFFASYCFCIKNSVWRSETFQNFWSEYRNISNKEVTLRRGERKFSRLILREFGGISLFDVDRFQEMLHSLTEEELCEALRDMVVTDPMLEAAQSRLMGAVTERSTIKEIRDLIILSSEAKNYIAAAPILSLKMLLLPFIKKNNERHYVLARRNILRAFDEKRLQNVEPVVIKEIRASV